MERKASNPPGQSFCYALWACHSTVSPANRAQVSASPHPCISIVPGYRIETLSTERPIRILLTIPAHHWANHAAIGRSATGMVRMVWVSEDGLMTFFFLMLGVFVGIAVWPNGKQGGKLSRYDWDQAI